MNTQLNSKIVSDLSQSSGVSESDVKAVLEKLRFTSTTLALENLVGTDRSQSVSLDDLILTIQFDKNLLVK